MPDDGNESASSLRQKLSESHQVAASALARAVIAERGLTHVKADDLKGKSLDEIESAALALEEERKSAGLEALKTMLRSQGIEDVESAVKAFLEGGSTDTQTPDAAALARAREVGSTSGTPAATGVMAEVMQGNNGPQQLQAYFEAQEAAKK